MKFCLSNMKILVCAKQVLDGRRSSAECRLVCAGGDAGLADERLRHVRRRGGACGSGNGSWIRQSTRSPWDRGVAAVLKRASKWVQTRDPLVTESGAPQPRAVAAAIAAWAGPELRPDPDRAMSEDVMDAQAGRCWRRSQMPWATAVSG